MRLLLGEVVVDLDAGRVLRGGQPVRLSQGEQSLLRALIDEGGGVVSRQDITSRVWEAPVGPGALDQLVRRLRSKIEPRPHAPRYLRTVVGHGYALCLDARTPLGLPSRLTRFVGRASELAALRAWMDDPQRPAVLWGPGGIGKSSLALEAARSGSGYLDEGVVLVELAALDEAQLAPLVLLSRLGVGQTSSDPLGQLRRVLQQRRLLVVLDNLEHLLPGAMDLVNTLAALPGPGLLITSQVIPQLPDVQPIRVEGLPLGAALELFEDRITHRRLSRRLDPAELAAARALCQLLEGVPLAIELAAALTRDRTTTEVLAGVRRDLDTLRVGFPDLPPRQRSLRATFLHARSLLDARSRASLDALAAFRGSFDRTSAHAIADAGATELAQLMDRGLIEERQHRYRLHPTTAHFAREDTPDEVLVRHAAWFMGRCAAREPDLAGPGVRDAIAELEAALPDLRPAWGVALARLPDQAAGAIRGLQRFLGLTTRPAEGRAMFEAAAPVLGARAQIRARSMAVLLGYPGATPPPLSTDPDPEERAYAALVRAMWFRGQQRPEDCLEALEAGLAATRSDSGLMHRRILCELGSQRARLGDHAGSRDLLDRAVALSLAHHDPSTLALAHLSRAWALILQGELDAAEADLAHAIEGYEALGTRSRIATAWGTRGLIANLQGRWPDAIDAEGEAIQHFRSIAPVQGALVRHLAALTVALAGAGALERSASVAEECTEMAQAVDTPGAHRCLWSALAEAARLQGAASPALEHYRALLVAAGRARLTRIRALEGIAWSLIELGRATEAREPVTEALELASPDDDPTSRAVVCATAFRLTGDRSHAIEALTLARSRGARIVAEVVAACTAAPIPAGDPEVARANALEALTQRP